MDVVYYQTRRGEQPVAAYLDWLARTGDKAGLAALIGAVELLEEFGRRLGMPQSRIIDRRARLYELRGGGHRIAYAFGTDRSGEEQAVLLHAWRKQTQKLDRGEAETALRRLTDWEERQ